MESLSVNTNIEFNGLVYVNPKEEEEEERYRNEHFFNQSALTKAQIEN